MITIYASKNCSHCKHVINTVHKEIGVDFDVRYVSDPKHREVVEKGGKMTTPYLVDDSTGTTMYESDDIIEYLVKTYGGSDS